MGREPVVLHEEEDLGTAMLKLPIPFNELNQLPIDSVYDFTDELKEIIKDPSFVLKDSRQLEDPNHTYHESIEDSNISKLMVNSSNPPTVTRIRSIVPKRSRNKRGRPKKQIFKSASSLVDSKVDITNKSCSHCGTSKTPLWREGPRGAGTLCNACGMQYKKGRLLPEYRPASSPDFKPNVHSNFHRKVMEIKRERILTSNSLGYQGFQH